MRRVLPIIIVIAVAIGAYEFARHKMHTGSGIPGAVHSTAATFSLQDVDGKPLDLASHRGKVVLLDFWATWCVPCRAEIPHFVEFQNKYASQGFQVIGISMDDGPDPVHGFYKDFKMNYPVAMGTTQLAESYGGILGLPVTFLIGRDGRIAAKYVGLTEADVVQKEIESLLKE